MPYFPVDDDFAFHRKVIAAGNAAIGAWTRAGSWCKKEATGGFVPENMAAAIGTRAEVRKLVEVGLWDKVLGGYLFHDWEHYGSNAVGSVEEERRDERRAGWRERKQRQRDRERDGHAVTGDVTDDVTGSGTGHGTPLRARARPESKSQKSELGGQSSVPETGRGARTDEVSPSEVEYIDRAMKLRVDFRKVRARIVEQAQETVPDPIVERVIVEALSRAKPRGGDRTGLVLTSLERDWHEWSQVIYAGATS